MSDSYKIYASKDYVDSKALPEGAAAHQMLVTNEKGEKIWEERTHYATETVTNLWEETTTTFENASENGYKITLPYGPYPSGNLRVIWDGEEYNTSSSEPYGNGYLYSSSYEDTGEPFCIVTGGMGWAYMYSATAGEHTYAISQVTTNAKTLDEVFIPSRVLFNNQGTTGAEAVAVCDTRGTASGRGSFSANCSHASGIFSAAFGSSRAIGQRAFAIGNNTDAQSENSCVMGRYNVVDDDGTYVFIVGNGSENMHSNAHTLDWNGNAWYAGGLKIGGTSQDDTVARDVMLAPATASVGQTIVVKAVDENNKPTEWETINPWVITSPNGTQFKLTINDEGILSATELV